MDPPAQHESEMVLYIPTPNDDDDDKNCSLKSESMMSTSNDVLIAGTTDKKMLNYSIRQGAREKCQLLITILSLLKGTLYFRT